MLTYTTPTYKTEALHIVTQVQLRLTTVTVKINALYSTSLLLLD